MPIQSIEVRFFGPTNFRGPRVSALCQSRSITRPRNYELNDFANAQMVASELCKTLDWHGRLHCGINRLGYYVFVFEGKDSEDVTEV